MSDNVSGFVQLLSWKGSIGEEWKKDAACKGLSAENYDLFFDKWTAGAREVCARCPVASICDAYQEEFEEAAGWRSGVWGGTSAPEREDRHRLRMNSRRVPEEEK